MLDVFWFSYNSLIIICIPLCMIFNKINNISHIIYSVVGDRF